MKNKLYTAIVLAVLGGGLSGCDKFLDEMPDKRTEVDTNAKVGELLVTAYSSRISMMIFEHRTDNVMDNGKQYGAAAHATLEQNYKWQEITAIDQNSPQGVWGGCYSAISAANQALEAIATIGENNGNLPYKG